MKNLYVLSRAAWCLVLMLLISGFVEAQSTTLSGKKLNTRHAELNESFAVYEVFELDITKVQALTQSGNAFDFSLQLGQQDWDVYLEHNDLRGPNYREVAITDEGHVLMPPRPNITFKGRTGTADTRFTITEDYMIARLVKGDNVYYLEPLSRLIDGLPKNQYVFYEINDILTDPAVECVHNAGKRYAVPHPDDPKGTTDPLRMMAECVEVEMATAGDFTMFTRYGSVMDVNDFILNVTNLMEPLYDDFSLSFVIVDQFVATTLASDPFDAAGDEAFDILDAFRPWAGMNFVNHDLGQLWTAKDIRGCNDDDDDDDSTNFTLIGCADAIGDVCGSNRYNVCEDFSNSSNCLRALSAHEIGHVFDGVHSQAVNTTIMWGNIVCGATTWTANNITRIQNHIDSRDCLAACDPCDLDDDAPAITCGTFSMEFDRCPTPLGPNTPNGSWVNVGADGMFNVAAGGSSILTVNLNGCVTDMTSDFANIDYMLVDSYQTGICPKSIFNEFVLRDECGNVSTDRIVTEHIFSEDDAPIITTNAMNMTVECDGSGNTAQLNAWLNSHAGAIADDCTAISWSNNFTALSDGCGATGSATVTFTATDACGNTATSMATFTIVDTAPPVISTTPGSLDVTIELTDPALCPTGFVSSTCYFSNDPDFPISVDVSVDGVFLGNFPGPDPADISDVCGLGLVSCSFANLIQDDCITTFDVIWIAQDDCGANFSEPFTQSFTLLDKVAPVFDLACQIDAIFTTEDGNVCPADATISLSEGDEIDVFTGWTVGGIPILPLQGCVEDNCADEGDLTITVDDITVVDDGTCSRLITVTFIADDGCGNFSDPFVCNYLFIDDTGPEVSFNGIPDMGTSVVECDLPSSTWDPLIEIADLTITDNCSAIDFAGITVELTQLYDGPCVGNMLTRWRQVFTVQDVCGNTTVYTLFTEIIDTTPPVFTSSPADVTIECDETAPLPELEAFDSCSEVVYGFTEVRTDGDCPYNYTLTRTWTATDGCGNSDDVVQVVTVEDTTPPVIEFVDEFVSNYTPGQDVFIECSEYGNISLIIASAAAAFDNCSGAVATSYDLEDLGGFDCSEYGYSGHLISTWKAFDECGNGTIATINWYLVDETAPVLQGVPDDICASTLPPVPNVQAVDDCEFAVLSFNQSEPIDCEGGQYVERTWTASDLCGNTTIATQRITLSDSDGPAISFDHPETGPVTDGSVIQFPVDCDQADDVLLLATLEAAVSIEDGCNAGESSIGLELLSEGDCLGEGYVRRYRLSVSATDACGNSSSFGLLIDLTDETPPVVTSPAEIVLNCGESIPMLMATDACGTIASTTFEDSQSIIASCPNAPQAFERIWTVTDACGNATTFAQSITIIDNEGPVFSGVPADACNDTTLDDQVTAFDECSGADVQVSMMEDMSNEPDCGQVLTRTWTATDACGNMSTATQQVFFDDENDPAITFTHPLLFGLESGDELFISVGGGFGDPNNPLIFTSADVEVSDNCASNLTAAVSVTSTASDDCATDGFLTEYQYEFIATDPCGNTAKASLTVYYIDKGSPDFFNVPADVEVFCDAVPPVAEIIVSDDYDEDVEVVFSETMTATPEGVLITRTWTATDDCGNTNQAQQEILVVDNTLSAEFVVDGDPVICNSDDNLLGVIISGGTPPYSYEWQLTFPLEDGYITSDPSHSQILYTMGFITQTFTVVVKDANGCLLTQSVTIVCDYSGEEQLTNGGDGPTAMNVYPNPVNERLRVKADGLGNQPVAVGIYSLYGQVMFQKELNYWPQEGYEIDTQRLPSGTYLIKLETEGLDPMIQQVVVLH